MQLPKVLAFCRNLALVEALLACEEANAPGQNKHRCRLIQLPKVFAFGKNLALFEALLACYI